MEIEQKPFAAKVLGNVRKIMNERGIKQVTVADAFDLTESQCSKILNGKSQLTLQNLSDFARIVEMREIDILTYPERFMQPSPNTQDSEPVEATLQIGIKNFIRTSTAWIPQPPRSLLELLKSGRSLRTSSKDMDLSLHIMQNSILTQFWKV